MVLKKVSFLIISFDLGLKYDLDMFSVNLFIQQYIRQPQITASKDRITAQTGKKRTPKRGRTYKHTEEQL